MLRLVTYARRDRVPLKAGLGAHIHPATGSLKGSAFDDLNEGGGHVEELGFGEIIRRGKAAAEGLPADIVYAGFSLGVVPAWALTQTRPGVKGAIFYHSCVPTAEFDRPWPAGEDLPVAKALVEEIEDGALFLYPGSGHLIADTSSADYDEQAAGLLKERTLAFLTQVG